MLGDSLTELHGLAGVNIKESLIQGFKVFYIFRIKKVNNRI